MSESVVEIQGHSTSESSWLAWVVCLSAGLFFFYEFFQLNLFDVINAPLREAFQVDAAGISWMSSTYLWADILFLLPAGIILDRYSPRSVILVAMMVCIIGTVGFALTHSFIVASFFHFLSGIGNAFCFLSCVVLVSRWFPAKRQAMVIGFVVTMAFIGGMMAHTPLAYLNAHFGWRNALLIDGLAGLAIFIWIYFIVQDQPKSRSNTTHQAESSNFLQALTNPQNWLAGFYTACLNLPIMVLCALWGASYLQVVHGLSEVSASNAVSLILVGSIIGCPIAGWLSDFMERRKPLMIIGALGSLVVVSLLLMDIALSKTALSALFFTLGILTSTQVISYPLVAESNPQSNTGAATGIASILIMGGGGVAQIVFGSLMQWHAREGSSVYNSADFQFAMWMFPIAILLALLAVLCAKETFCRRS